MTLKTHLQWFRDQRTDAVHFSGVVTASTMIKLRMSPLDRATLAQASHDDSSSADFVLALELVFRRMQEQQVD